MGRFRKVDSLLPEAGADDVFGQHAVKLMKRAAQIGYDEAIQEELESPTWDDPDWCRMIAARASGQVPVFSDDDRVTFRCPKCKDTGFVHHEDAPRFGSTYRVAAFCDPCAWRMTAKAEWLRKQEREAPRGSGRLRDRFSDD